MRKIIVNIIRTFRRNRYLRHIELFIVRTGWLYNLIEACVAFFEKKHPTEEMLIMRELYEGHLSEFTDISASLCDIESKNTFENIIKYKMTREHKYLSRIKIEKQQYFLENIIKTSDNEVFIDGGSYDGINCLEFSNFTNGRYKKIFAFEPSKNNIEAVYETIRKNNIDNITVLNLGLWSTKGSFPFDDLSGCGTRIDENGKSVIQVDSIDNLLIDEDVSFIKMDIEGAELEALIGARQVIQKHKPKLAISIYHKPEDYYKIPLYIKTLVPEYQFFIRHHSYGYYDTVLYAVL